MSTGATRFARHIQDYRGLLDTIEERCLQMQISRLELDHVSGVAAGYTSKLLGPEPRKTFGVRTLGPILQTLGLLLIAVEDPVARDKTLARREPSVGYNQRFGNKNNSKKSSPPIERQTTEAAPAPPVAQLETPHKPEPVSRSHLRVIQLRSRGASACRT